MNPQGQKQPSNKVTSMTSTTKSDPVCGADLKSGAAETKQTMYRGQSYTFCGEACRQKFEANPDQYVKTNA